MIRTNHVPLIDIVHEPKAPTGLLQLPKGIMLEIAEKAGPAGFSKVALLDKAHNAVVKTALIDGGPQKFSPSSLHQKICDRVDAMYDREVQEIVKPLVHRGLELSKAWEVAPTRQKRLHCFNQLSHVARGVYDVHARQVDGNAFADPSAMIGGCLGGVGIPTGLAALFQHGFTGSFLWNAIISLPLVTPGVFIGSAVGLGIGASAACIATTIVQSVARHKVQSTLESLEHDAEDSSMTIPAHIEMQRL